ncbi:MULTISPECIES: YhgE/Pip domain-containing protein [unclassified Bacillus (in: firmicutes)]|uniref:YhgE/Pip domain-containing protein n=1 Tax=unclassified Bacillus (in: firmicutes) TaxID=185979 RepID=UPI0008EB755A|nr:MULTISPECIES: YhgE/Pip domain-containing protein [unclassified Bacillus (in: firmicutes)]SFJ61343.1 putative membrane protein [Bacillus sp. 71mf]SFT19776.1 putative membrane protein [Bacillus sp. 103mf]
MKQIWRIYTTDIRNVAKHWAAIVIIIGLIILPSLYAWFNIKASWDPYGSTKDVPIAISNKDKGANLRGKDINIGKEVVDSLKKNKNLGWKFVDEKEAIHGVEHGEYYASITIPKDFSEKIATVLDDNPQKPEIQYYVNEKVNAIAPKITSKGASGIVEEIGKNFVKTANGEIFKIFNELGIDLETNLPSIEKVKDLVFKLEAQFPEINKIVDTALTDADKAQGLVTTAQDTMPKIESIIHDSQQLTKDVDTFFANNDQTLEEAPARVKRDLEFAKKAADRTAQITDSLRDPLANVNKESIKNNIKSVQGIVNGVKGVSQKIPSYTDKAREELNTADPEKVKEIVEGIQQLYPGAIEQIDLAIKKLQDSNQPNKDKELKRLEDLKTAFTAINKMATEAANDPSKNKQSIENSLNQIDSAAKEAEGLADSVIDATNNAMNIIDNGVGDKGYLEPAKQGLYDVQSQLQKGINFIDDIIPVLNDVDKLAGHAGKTTNIPDTVAKLNNAKGDMQKGINATNKALDVINSGKLPSKDDIENINAAAKDASKAIDDILARYDSEIVPNFNDAIAKTKKINKEAADVLNTANEKLPDVKKLLEDASKGLALGKEDVTKVKAELPEAEKKIKEIANKIREFESQEDLKDIIRLLKHDVEKQSDYFANPVNLKENKLFPIPNYGSAMSPFYTVLALWVGALLMVSLLTVEVHEEDAEYKSYHIYFGRFLTFLSVGLAQAFIVAMGDMFLLGTYVVDKFWFVLFSMLIAGVFVCIVYSLVSVFGNIGKSMAIVLLVLQVAGSGGTFPIQMTPKFFQAIYPFLPFTYAIRIIRETVGGMLWDIVWKDLLVLGIWVGIMLVIALLLKKPINKSSERFVENAKGSKLIH